MAWILRAEFEYLLCLASERLDVAKSRALLHASLDARLLLTDDLLYNMYIDAGKAALKHYLGEGKDRQGLGWQSRTFQAAVMACICDDVNLAHVFTVLRVEELLENLGDELSPSQCARVMLAIIGELHLVRRDMQEAESSDSPEFVEFKEKSSRFLQKASLLLMSLIAESGRDRFCYVKEALIHPDATCSRPAPLTSTNLSRPVSAEDAALAKAWRGREPFQLAQVLRADLDGSDLYTSSMYALYKRGDPVFETLLHSGSLLSLWHRLHSICRHNVTLGQETIKWSVVRQAPRLNRLRQLILTRLIQCLYQPQYTLPLGGPMSVDEKRSNDSDRALAGLLAESLVLSGVKVWCYESLAQKQQIMQMAGEGRATLASKLDSILCIQIDRGFVEMPLGQELPDLDGLASLFAEVPGTRPMEPYEGMHYTDMNLYTLVPDTYTSGILSSNWPSTSYRIGSRLHRATPNMGILDESRFFTNPMVTALLNKNALVETVNSFMSTEAVETV
ncbi:hypothetical protein, conserved [Eimeria tenella]|uniref:Uncharacterized protein n=1 Tax=Eimeria tenella TaxID=5802 RepID=U6KV70_EIMTE|nr:hypothetical protein, conserved [Eimeria tenella]CDJ42007.1 hypothetical protein, conserved [Eimeria tenella]|eukprot:XP_013232757.1 hypothetical protein, conserved [Eimeria tenella]